MLNMEHNTNESSFEITELNLNDIYRQISVENKVNFDQSNSLEIVTECIESCFDTAFKQIDSTILVSNVNKLNVQFIHLMKYCNNYYNMKEVHYIFIGFCDYFDLEYNLVYLALHEKLQALIKNGYISLVGKEIYNKEKRKANPNQQMTIFDLLNK